MSYQVLARKFRPANFQALEGQEHVLRALVNALENNRLHHAYLFTGTRGIGKTTIARILAKCLNCEQGVSAIPCGTCSTCVEIAEGRSVDLIEVDAASRTKVEDTRELLDNVQYMPTRNRYKIYLIDEVHMLSNHSFNALLKTLEEPPEHVKFLLATTDPKKLPVTVLSRCLQFNLKKLSPERIVNYLKQILSEEDVPFEEDALWQLGRAADGSMRDALSLTDQAISFGNNSVNDADVTSMLGSIDRREIYEIISCLIDKDAASLLAKIASLDEFAPDYSALLADFLSVMHRVSVSQAVSEAIDNSQGDRELVLALAESISREDVQLFYQIGLIGQRDMPYSPDARTGFEMVMLRMLAFTPGSAGASVPPQDDSEIKKKTIASNQSTSKVAEILASLSSEKKEGNAKQEELTAPELPEENPVESNQPVAETPETFADQTKSFAEEVTGNIDDETGGFGKKEVAESESNSNVDPVSHHKTEIPDLIAENWVAILPQLGLSGVTQSLAANCTIQSCSDSVCQLVLSEQHASLWNSTHESRIESALNKLYQSTIKVTVTIGKSSVETPAEKAARNQVEATNRAIEVIESDKKVQQIVDSFDGKLDRETISARRNSGD